MRNVEKVDLDQATPHQRIAIDKIIEFFDSSHQMLTLEGFAGAGKSWVVNLLLEHMIQSRGWYNGVGALTHKAVFVLNRMAEFESENLTYNTIHSLLAVKPWMDNDGNEHFIKDKKQQCRIGEYEFIVVDEASMLDDKLFSYIKEELEQNPSVKVIFVGDGKQLPPVGQRKAIPFDKEMRAKFKIQYASLTEIVRQKGTNPIIPLSKDIRKGKYKFQTKVNDKGEGIILVPREKQAKILRKLFCCGKFEENSDYCRLVSWTNAQVNYYNNNIRKMIYKDKIKKFVEENREQEGFIDTLKVKYPFFDLETKTVKNLPNIVKGDKVITDKPVFMEDGKSILFNTNEELIVDDLMVMDHMVDGEVYKVYQASVTNIWDETKKSVIPIIHDKSAIKLECELERLQKLAKKEKRGSMKARNRWIAYYNLDKSFAKLKYLPSMTTYKSQGSTYENVIVNVRDIENINDFQLKLQHLYVGVTRASKRVFVFV